MGTNAENFRRETIDRWEEFCLTGKSVPHDVVMAWLETWGTEDELEAPIAKVPVEAAYSMLADGDPSLAEKLLKERHKDCQKEELRILSLSGSSILPLKR